MLTTNRRHHESGVILILCLVVVTLLVMAVSTFLFALSTQRDLARAYRKKSMVDIAVLSAQQHAIGVLKADYLDGTSNTADPNKNVTYRLDYIHDTPQNVNAAGAPMQLWQSVFSGERYDETDKSYHRMITLGTGAYRLLGKAYDNSTFKTDIFGVEFAKDDADPDAPTAGSPTNNDDVFREGYYPMAYPHVRLGVDRWGKTFYPAVYDKDWTEVTLASGDDPFLHADVKYILAYSVSVRDLSGCVLANRTRKWDSALDTYAITTNYGGINNTSYPKASGTFSFPDSPKTSNEAKDPWDFPDPGTPASMMHSMLASGHRMSFFYYKDSYVPVTVNYPYHPMCERNDSGGNPIHNRYRDFYNWEMIRVWQQAAEPGYAFTSWGSPSRPAPYGSSSSDSIASWNSDWSDASAQSGAYTYSFTPFGNTGGLRDLGSLDATYAADPETVKWEININTAPQESVYMTLMAMNDYLLMEDPNFRFNGIDKEPELIFDPYKDVGASSPIATPPTFTPFAIARDTNSLQRTPLHQHRTPHEIHLDEGDWNNCPYYPEHDDHKTFYRLPASYADENYLQSDFTTNRLCGYTITHPSGGLYIPNPAGASPDLFTHNIMSNRPYLGSTWKDDLATIRVDPSDATSDMTYALDPNTDSKYLVDHEWRWSADDSNWVMRPADDDTDETVASKTITNTDKATENFTLSTGSDIYLDPRIKHLLAGDKWIKWTVGKSRFYHVTVHARLWDLNHRNRELQEQFGPAKAYEFVYHLDPNGDGDPSDSVILYQHRFGDEE